ncbi:Uncharacterized protein OS=Pirellula staleyi (strain ATCC 27377 / DSM 6068 / ICPB 4128) GN=Psta_3326 PE=4 SV=1: DUF4129 [Gemmataceae bacterium]|nr:Uncharacterized protein OS=Pirellula staleyi (strain ATCC 27377 / DSM 6068 / ICPB 4128) GN=Psta_3326 PE=4 SV=1: DUF4129 [Gemmataceae bacterium]VTT97653.1 Uncharacterized protein OS=Pirellula staleyi (strain ATCC 27377 / DSM 6068 / ICPB 4128) GN=Psta_3326 PE=4 SV=1: DUF4129 [Gemmataceae bacterium]
MATDRDPPTATDYVVTALSPVLVMLMVGSIVFFLVEVLYEGRYSGRLLYTLFFFVVGAVLVARISIESDAGRASVYGLALGGAVYVALLTYVEYPSGWLRSYGWLVNLGLMLLTWWSAHKLTWDCTHIDEKQKGAGRGLLSAAGLEGASETSPGREPGEVSATTEKTRKKKKRSPPDSRVWDWIARYQKHREAQRAAPHTPGVWVVYFALAALPLFALGQSLVAPDDAARRRATFLQMVVYVGSALGLLVTTSLLGLRRYLRQRRAKIPMALSGGWLALGGVLIAAFLTAGAFLPRPHAEVPWFGIERAGKSERDASKYAVRRDGAGKGDGADGRETKAGDGKASGQNGQPGGNTGESGDGTGDSGSGGDGKDGKSGGASGGDKKGEATGGKNGEKSSPGKKPESGDSRDASDPQKRDSDGDDATGGTPPAATQLAALREQLGEALKKFVFVVVGLIVITAAVLGVLRYLAPFTNWAARLLDALRNWWAGLFGTPKPKRRVVASEVVAPVRPPPFAEFANPFADGTARGRDPAELVAYTFLALEAWGYDRDSAREPGETPLEFVNRLAEAVPDLWELLTPFGEVYVRVSYSRGGVPPEALGVLRTLWDGLSHAAAAV